MKFKALILICLIFTAFSGYSQTNRYGVHILTNYGSEVYGASTQNWSIVQDLRGVIYFGNNDAVLEYDGKTWKKIYVTNNSIVRSLAVDKNGTVFVGAVGEFGFLAPDISGEIKYNSLSSKLDSSVTFLDVWKTFEINDKIYFSTKTYLFEYDYKNVIIKGDSEKRDGNMFHFQVDDKIILGNYNDGLLLLNEFYESIKDGALFANDYIMSIISFTGENKLITSYFSGTYLYNFNNGVDTSNFIPEETQNELKNSYVTYSEKIDSANYAFATINSGIINLDSTLKIKEIINKESGLLDNTIYELCYSNSCLWAALENGISKVELNSPFRLINSKQGLEGSILDVLRYNDTLYVSTHLGVSYLDYSSDTIFKSINSISYESWDLFNYNDIDGNKLLLCNNYGLFEIKNKNGFELAYDNFQFSYVTYKMYQRSNGEILVGYLDGLFKIKRINNKWEVVGNCQTIKNVRSIAEDNFNNIWLGTVYDGVYEIKENGDTINYDETSGLPDIKDIQIYYIHNDLIFATQKGLYSFNYETENFEEFDKFGDVYCNGSCGVFLMFEDSNSVWINPFNKNKEWIERVFVQNDGTYVRDTIAFKRLEIKSLQVIYPDKNGIVWFGTADALYSFDKNFQRNFENKYYTLLRKITLGEDSVIFNGNYYKKSDNEIGFIASTEQPEELIYKFPYNQNSITFEYAAPFFEAEEKTEFSVCLEGFDKKWTNWKIEYKSIYTNLREGKYIFKVKAKNVYGVESIVAEYRFSIAPPWYRTVLAYICYVLIAVILVLVIIKLYTRQLVKDKQRLEKIVEERTVEIRQKNVVLEHQKTELEQQKEEIEAQRDELETQRDELDTQNKIVVSQRDKIEKQNHDIKDSITYASRIQNAMIPPNEIIKHFVSEFFILWRPRDIVSGDFYWAKEKGNNLILVVADCTGHGVPGAFMSMLGISLLNEIVTNIDIVKSDTILNKLRENIILSLHQTGEIGGSQDGMDLSMIIVDKQNKKVQFSGANNPLVLVRKLDNNFSEFNNDENFKVFDNTETNVRVIDIKADKMPIGISRKMDVKFSCFTFGICEGDALYLFSDGYPDQFGGPTGKKFMIKSLKEIFAEIYNENFENQRTILNNKMDEWTSFAKKDGTKQDQIDDILVMGVKI